MAKRFTDSDKWQDVWFTELSNDNKIIWLYLLDTCDHAGVIKLNLRLLNFNCSTNITVEDFKSIFKNRVIQINEESWFIPKFCSYQYGNDYLQSNTKAVTSAIKILLQLGIVKEIKGILTLNIPLGKGIDTLKDKDKDMDMDKVQNKVKGMDINKEINKVINKDKDIDQLTDEMMKVIQKRDSRGWNSLTPAECNLYYEAKEILNIK